MHAAQAMRPGGGGDPLPMLGLGIAETELAGTRNHGTKCFRGPRGGSKEIEGQTLRAHGKFESPYALTNLAGV